MSLSRDNKPDEELYQACLNGDTATVSRLLDTLNPNYPIHGYAHVPLYLACFGGHRETVSLLSERGANFSARCARPSLDLIARYFSKECRIMKSRESAGSSANG